MLATNPVNVFLRPSSRYETRHRVHVDLLIKLRSKDLQSRVSCSPILRSDALGEHVKFVTLLVPILRKRVLATQDVVDIHPSSAIARNSVPALLANFVS